jgi:uncharacterized membrane protein
MPCTTAHLDDRSRGATGSSAGNATVVTIPETAMQPTSVWPQPSNAVEARVTIRRPVGEVFEFYRDFENLPRFLGDVMAIERISPVTSRWAIQGPLGLCVNLMITVTEERSNELIRYETATFPGLKTYWEVHFANGPAPGETEVREVIRTPLGGLGRAALNLIGKPPAEEIPSNLHRLKEVLETGTVTDTSHAVAGKFDRPTGSDGVPESGR